MIRKPPTGGANALGSTPRRITREEGELGRSVCDVFPRARPRRCGLPWGVELSAHINTGCWLPTL
jgi:hypothetical protein